MAWTGYGLFIFILSSSIIGVSSGASDAAQTIKDEAGRTIYTIDDEGNVTMFENSPGIDITLSVARGTKQEMQPKVTDVTPASISAGSSVVLKLKGKNFVGATVKFDRPGIEVSPFATNKPISLDIPIRVAPNMAPGDVTLEIITPIGATTANLKITELQIGLGPGRRDDRKPTTIPTTAPLSCPDGMAGVAAESGGFCIDIDETITGDYRKAEKACAATGKRLCQAMEWRRACEQATNGSLPLKNISGNWEWTGSWISALKGDFEDPLTRSVLMGQADCQSTMDVPQWKPDPYPGRCCK
jgi:hypothetical protein